MRRGNGLRQAVIGNDLLRPRWRRLGIEYASCGCDDVDHHHVVGYGACVELRREGLNGLGGEGTRRILMNRNAAVIHLCGVATRLPAVFVMTGLWFLFSSHTL